MLDPDERPSQMIQLSQDSAVPEWTAEFRGSADAARLRKTFRAFLHFHAEPESDIEGAETIIAELIANAVRHGGGAAWICLDWRNAHPTLTIKDRGPGFCDSPQSALTDLYAESGRGLAIIRALARNVELGNSDDESCGACVRVILPVRRGRSK